MGLDIKYKKMSEVDQIQGKVSYKFPDIQRIKIPPIMALSEYMRNRQKWNAGEDKPAKNVKSYSIPKKSAKKIAEEKSQKDNREGETDLVKWFTRIMKNEKPVCWETGNPINKSDKVAWHGSIAHILPKKLFPSVQCHPQNYLILQMYGGTHGQFDSSWHNASKMKVWQLAVERFIMIEPDIAIDERKYLPDILLEELQKRNPFPEITKTDYQ